MTDVIAEIRGWHLIGLILTLSAVWAGAAWFVEYRCPECRGRRARR